MERRKQDAPVQVGIRYQVDSFVRPDNEFIHISMEFTIWC